MRSLVELTKHLTVVRANLAKPLKASEFWPLTAMTMKPEHVASSEIEITSENWEGQGSGPAL